MGVGEGREEGEREWTNRVRSEVRREMRARVSSSSVEDCEEITGGWFKVYEEMKVCKKPSVQQRNKED